MKVTIFVTLSDIFFKICWRSFPIKSYKPPLYKHSYYLASKLLNIFGMHVKHKQKKIPDVQNKEVI
jgi:hypothetical protein